MVNKVEIKYHINDDSFSKDLISITITLTNHSNVDVFLLKRGTPFQNTLQDCFDIKYNNQDQILFDGFFLKDGQNCLLDVVQIKPNEFISKKIDLSESYKVSKKGNYKLKFKDNKINISTNIEYLLYDIALVDCSKFEILNPIFEFNLDQKFTNIKTIGERNRRETASTDLKGIIFLNGTPEQKKIIRNVTKQVIKNLSMLRLPAIDDDMFMKWFGVHDRLEFNLVKKNYKTIFTSIKSKYIKYYFYSENQEMDEPCAFASTSENGDMINIYSKLFWKASDQIDFECKFGVIIHEFSHIYCKTDDDGGENVIECQRTATMKPEVAIRCANNYEYFAEDSLK